MGPTCRIQSYTASDRLAKSRCRFGQLAERKGFEPSRRLNTICALSRGVPSTTRPPLRCGPFGLELTARQAVSVAARRLGEAPQRLAVTVGWLNTVGGLATSCTTV